MVGTAGVESIVTVTNPLSLQPRQWVITLYNPLLLTGGLAIEGFCRTELNPFGPLQLYVSPRESGLAKRFRVFGAPEHMGSLLVAVTTGKAFKNTLVLVVSLTPACVLTT